MVRLLTLTIPLLPLCLDHFHVRENPICSRELRPVYIAYSQPKKTKIGLSRVHHPQTNRNWKGWSIIFTVDLSLVPHHRVCWGYFVAGTFLQLTHQKGHIIAFMHIKKNCLLWMIIVSHLWGLCLTEDHTVLFFLSLSAQDLWQREQ